MADLAERGFTRHDISLFRLDRLRRQATGPRSSQPAEQPDGRPRSFSRKEDIRTFW
jgi:hypothetical protein